MTRSAARIVTPLLALGFALASATAAGQEAQSVGASMEEDRIVVTVDGEEFTAYKFG